MRYLNLISILFVLTSLSIFTSCNKDDDPGITAENEVNAFIWGAMNSWYYWQEDVDDLKDEQFASSSERNTFLNQFDCTDLHWSPIWFRFGYDLLSCCSPSSPPRFGLRFGFRFGHCKIFLYNSTCKCHSKQFFE